jgi:1-acyl-sn-glycerol-3-phosphate acyltransferase
MFSIKFLLFIIYNYFAPLLCGLLLMIPMTICKIFNNNTIARRMKNIFYMGIGFIVRSFLNVKFYTNSNTLIKEIYQNKNQIIVIQNHISEIDSLFFYSLFNNNPDPNFNSVTLMKKGVAYQLLGIGIMDLFGDDVFLSRNIIRDSYNINNIKKENNVVYFFPEGTIYTKETKARSDAYCITQNLPIYKYVLYPRITGLGMIIANNNVNKLYDITCIFDSISKDNFGKTFDIKHFLLNGLPSKIFLNFKKYDIDSKNLVTQAEKIFQDKNLFIKKFDINTMGNVNDNGTNKENTNGKNKHQIVDYDFVEGLYSLIISLLISYLSIYLYIEFDYVRYVYLVEIILFLLYLHILY